MWHGYGWMSAMRAGDQKPQVTRQLLARVLAYARPYTRQIIGMLVSILATTGLSLISPLIFRRMIDKVLPARDIRQLVVLAVALLLIPVINGLISVLQRRWNSA